MKRSVTEIRNELFQRRDRYYKRRKTVSAIGSFLCGTVSVVVIVGVLVFMPLIKQPKPFDSYGTNPDEVKGYNTCIEYTYDELGRCTRLQKHEIWSLSNGRSKKVHLITKTYEYNNEGRLSRECSYELADSIPYIRIYSYQANKVVCDLYHDDDHFETHVDILDANGNVIETYYFSLSDPETLHNHIGYTYNTKGQLIQKVVYGSYGSDDNHTTYEYNEDGLLIRVISAPHDGLNGGFTEYQYDAYGNEIEVTYQYSNGESHKTITEITYDAAGRMTSRLRKHFQKMAGETEFTESVTAFNSYESYEYLDNGNVIRRAYNVRTNQLVEYELTDSNGNPLVVYRIPQSNVNKNPAETEADTTYSEETGETTVETTEETAEDFISETGLLEDLPEEVKNTNGITEYTYDDYGRLVKEEASQIKHLDHRYYGKIHSYTNTYEYDSEGRLLRRDSFLKEDWRLTTSILYSYEGNTVIWDQYYNGKYVTSYVTIYDGNGNEIETYYTNLDRNEIRNRVTNRYNCDNLLMERSFHDDEGNVDERCEYFYDDSGRLIRMSQYPEEIDTEYRYDSYGNLVEEITTHPSCLVEKKVYYYVYDSLGRIIRFDVKMLEKQPHGDAFTEIDPINPAHDTFETREYLDNGNVIIRIMNRRLDRMTEYRLFDQDGNILVSYTFDPERDSIENAETEASTVDRETTQFEETEASDETEATPETTVKDENHEYTVEELGEILHLSSNMVSVLSNEAMLHNYYGYEYLRDYVRYDLKDYSVVSAFDLDEDGIREVVTLEGMEVVFILREYEGTVYGWHLSFRGIYDLRIDGTFNFAYYEMDIFTYGTRKLNFNVSDRDFFIELERVDCYRDDNGRFDSIDSYERFYIGGVEVTEEEHKAYKQSKELAEEAERYPVVLDFLMTLP